MYRVRSNRGGNDARMFTSFYLMCWQPKANWRLALRLALRLNATNCGVARKGFYLGQSDRRTQRATGDLSTRPSISACKLRDFSTADRPRGLVGSMVDAAARVRRSPALLPETRRARQASALEGRDLAEGAVTSAGHGNHGKRQFGRITLRSQRRAE